MQKLMVHAIKNGQLMMCKSQIDVFFFHNFASDQKQQPLELEN